MNFPAVLLVLSCSVLATGCGVLAELAYDDVAQRDRMQCERLVSMAERQSCLQRVNTAKRQAEERRKN